MKAQRGYSLLASEPSISAPTIVVMLLSTWFFLRQGKLSQTAAGGIFLLVGYMIFLNRSGSIMILMMLMLAGAGIGALVKASWIQRLSVLALFGGTLATLMFFATDLLHSNIRILNFLGIALTTLMSHNPDIMRMLVSLGAQRIIPIALVMARCRSTTA